MTATTPWFIRARLKTRQLMLLTAICDEGNIHRAAEVLNMSQPAASKLLKDLEDMLGVTLFDRQPRGMRPNWYGETMIRHARIALSSLREAGQDVELHVIEAPYGHDCFLLEEARQIPIVREFLARRPAETWGQTRV